MVFESRELSFDFLATLCVVGRSRNREVITIVNDDVGVDVVEVDEDDITDASYHKKHHKRKKHKSKKHRKHK